MELFRENLRLLAVNYFRKKSFIVDVQLSSKYVVIQQVLLLWSNLINLANLILFTIC